MLSPKGLPRSKRQLSQTWISSNITSLSDRLYETFARHCLLDQRISIYALTYAPIVVDILAECPLRCEAMMSTAAFSRYLFTTHVEPLNPLSLEVALNALRNPPIPNGSGSIEKSTVVGLPVRAITDMSTLKISTEVVVSVMSFPNFSMSTTDRLCGTNLHGIWNDALWGMFPCKCIAEHRFRHTVVLHACFLDVPNRDFVDFVEVFERDCLHLQLHFLGLKVAILTRCF